MASLADDLTVYLDSASTSIATGTNLFKNSIVETTGQRTVFVIATRGQASAEKFSGSLPAFTRPSADIVVRSTESIGGPAIAGSTGTEALAYEMWTALVGIANTTLNSRYYLRVDPQTEPYFMGHDDKGRAMFGFTVDTMRATTGAST